jgi:putative membrane protein
MPHSIKHTIQIALKGFCMGAADVVPGVSGGTMALILGIYQRWLLAIKSFDAIWFKAILCLDIKTVLNRPHFGFIIPLVFGIFAAIVFFTRVIPLPQLLHSHPELIYALFFGLVLGSISSIVRQTPKITGLMLILMCAGAALAWFVVTRVPVNTPDSAWFIMFCGFIAISAMLLPGLSGAFLLLILHKYEAIMNGISHLDFAIILPFSFGALLGVITFSRVLSWLLARYYRETLFSIVGVLLGSLWVIWPFQIREYVSVRGKEKLISSTPILPDQWNNQVYLVIALVLFGMFLVLFLQHLSHKKTG